MVGNNINSRYRYEKNIGEGAMGKVDLVYDRIERKYVALKTITAKDGKDVLPLREALINEFKMLASINHPHIVRVLDFGFTHDGMPYFTMEYLEDAVDIVSASQSMNYQSKINHSIQMLQALQFLHQRPILHRDLKPANILVTNGTTKLLDFGLSIYTKDAHKTGAAGTVAYMPPEVLTEVGVYASSDLFAIGFIIYQMFNNGEHPFSLKHVNLLIYRMLEANPDFTDLDVDTALLNVIRKLVEKNPADRYQDANTVIDELLPLSGKTTAPETVEVRESYLTSAPFVGRTTPLTTLLTTLEEAIAGHGQIHLVGGISGIGKSRLLDELRIQALVKNVLVLRGHTQQSTEQPYELWHRILTHLCLLASLDDKQASILKPLVSDIDSLLEREIPDAPSLTDENVAQKRLFDVIGNMVAKSTQPLLIILEDLHWVDDSSHALLQHLITYIQNSPVMVVASYRDDEAPALPSTLPDVPVIALQRLSNNSIRDLVRKMLGQAADRPSVIDFLVRESDGNAYFLVEIIRELAQQTEIKGLGQIGIDTLPEKIFPRGIRDIVERQLERLNNPTTKEMLYVAALDGNHIDLELLKRIHGVDADTDLLLANAAGAGILERDGEVWRFTHSKLRELLLEEISDKKRLELHFQIAEEKVHLYRANRELRRGQEAHIAYHFEQAQHIERAGNLYFEAAKYAMSNHAIRIAKTYFKKAQKYIPLENDHAKHIHIYQGLGTTQRLLMQLDAAEKSFNDMLQLTEKSQATNVPTEVILQSFFGLTEVYRDMGRYPQMIVFAKRAIDFAKMLNATDTNLQVVDNLGSLAVGLLNTQKYEAARQVATETYELATKLPADDGARRAIRNFSTLGRIDFRLWERFYNQERAIIHLPIAERFTLQSKHMEQAIQHFERAVSTARELGHTHTLANVVNNLAMAYMSDGQLGKAIDCFKETLEIFVESGAELGIIVVHINLARLFNEFEMYDLAESIITQVLQAIANHEHFFGMLEAYDHLTTALYMQEKYGNALEYISEWLDHAITSKNSHMMGLAWYRAGRIAYELDIDVAMDNTERLYTWQDCFQRSEEYLSGYNRDRLQLLYVWAKYENPNNEVQRIVGTLISELGRHTDYKATALFEAVPDSVVPLDDANETLELPQMSAEPEVFIRNIKQVNLPLAARYIATYGVDVSPALKNEICAALIERASNPSRDLKSRITDGKTLGQIGDPRFQKQTGRYGDYILPPMIQIDGGSYRIGDDKSIYGDERPAHQVKLTTFHIGQCPVTNVEYEHFINAGAYQDDQWWDTTIARAWRKGQNLTHGHQAFWRANWQTIRNWSLVEIDAMVKRGLITEPIAQGWKAIRQMEKEDIDTVLEEAYPKAPIVIEPAFWLDNEFNSDSQPVVGISWFEANAYCKWLSAQTGKTYRLPSEVEWEAATRGLDGKIYPYGNAYDSTRANTAENLIQRTTPISVFADRENKHALNDTIGNVWEWTSSAYEAYPYVQDDGREDLERFVRRVLRGNSWSSYLSNTRATLRYRHYPTFRHNYFGFRLLCL